AAVRACDAARHRGGNAAELQRRTVGAEGTDPYRLLVGVDPGKAVEVGQTLVIIIWVAHTLDRLADLIVDEFERSRAENVLLVPARVLVESFFLIDPTIGVSERRQKRARREFQMEDYGCRIGRLDRVDHHVMAL